MNGLSRTIIRLTIEPAMLLFGAATFAVQFGIQLPLLAGVSNAALWSGAGTLIWGVIAVWLAWWIPRELVGVTKGAGRFWKWLGYTIGLGIVSGLPWLVSGFIMGFSGSQRLIDWPTALFSIVLQAALLLFWVRVYAVAISGDRLRFAAIRDELSARVFELLPFFVPPLVASWASSMVAQSPSVLGNINPYVSAGADAAVQAVASCIVTAVLVAAYLEVDQSADLTKTREVFK